MPDATGSTSSSEYAATASDTFALIGSTRSATTASRTSFHVVSPIRI